MHILGNTRYLHHPVAKPWVQSPPRPSGACRSVADADTVQQSRADRVRVIKAITARLRGRVAITGVQIAGDRPVNLRVAVHPPIGRGDTLLAVDLVIQLHAPVVVRARLALAIHVVVEVPWKVGLRDERQGALSYAAEPVGRNAV